MFTAYRFPSVFLRRNISDASNGYNKCTNLALGRPDLCFVLFFVNDGFHFMYQSLFYTSGRLPGLKAGSSCSQYHSPGGLEPKVKIPLKIGIFVRKVMHESIPTFLNLCNRGINVHSTCPLCNSEDESTTHLFLYCPFARAIWHGSSSGIHTSELNNVSVQG